MLMHHISFSCFYYILFQSNFDDTERNKSFVPVNYREFVHTLEEIIEPTKKKYTATQEEFKDDKNQPA